jgi:hypothetical protein
MIKLLALLFLTTMSLISFGQAKWKSLNDIPTKWIKTERDNRGYLVYDPCDGGTPRIYMDSGYITIYWQVESPSRYAMNKFTRLEGNKAFYISASDKKGNITFTAEIKNGKQHLVLWSFGDYKWVMTPLKFKSKFRQVNNPCATEKKPEKEFLKVEF